MKNVLVIVYYFPPMGGSGVQRPLKFVKYLREFGWNPIVLCPEPGAYHTFDETLEKKLQGLNIEVHRVKGNTPLHKTGNKVVKLPVWLELKLRKISTFFWIPDNKKGWIKTGFEKAKELIQSKNIDLIFASAPPYSNLLLAQSLKQEFELPVVMDLRDDWLDSHLLSFPTKWHYKKMKSLELKTLSHADQLITINHAIADAIDGRRVNKHQTKVISHGFDPEDFNNIKNLKKDENKLTFLYSGTFYPDSGPEVFISAMALYLKENPKYKSIIELKFQGTILAKQVDEIEKQGLLPQSTFCGYLPHHEAIVNMGNADILWLNNAHKKFSKVVSLGKTYEYMASKKPILALIPDGELKDTMIAYEAAFITSPDNVELVKKKIDEIVTKWESNNLPRPNQSFINKFNRRELTSELATIFNVITGN